MTSRRALGRLIAVVWLVSAIALFVACACISLPHVVGLAAGALLVVHPSTRAVLVFSFAASAYLVVILLAGLLRTHSETVSTLVAAVATVVLTALIAVLSLLALRRN